jgi:hypothetical protein
LLLEHVASRARASRVGYVSGLVTHGQDGYVRLGRVGSDYR